MQCLQSYNTCPRVKAAGDIFSSIKYGYFKKFVVCVQGMHIGIMAHIPSMQNTYPVFLKNFDCCVLMDGAWVQHVRIGCFCRSINVIFKKHVGTYLFLKKSKSKRVFLQISQILKTNCEGECAQQAYIHMIKISLYQCKKLGS